MDTNFRIKPLTKTAFANSEELESYLKKAQHFVAVEADEEIRASEALILKFERTILQYRREIQTLKTMRTRAEEQLASAHEQEVVKSFLSAKQAEREKIQNIQNNRAKHARTPEEQRALILQRLASIDAMLNEGAV